MAGGAGDMNTWPGLEKQPASSRNAIVSELGRMKDLGKKSVTILLLGKSGVGKSSLVNTLVGDRVRSTNPFQPEALQAVEVKQWFEGLEVSIIDTPGLIEAGDVSQSAMKTILQFLVGRTVDVVLYVDRLDAYSVDLTDQLLIRAITKALGKQVWSSALVVLTRAFLTPSDGRSYQDFVELRASAMQQLIRKQAGLPSSHQVRVLRVENNAARCRTNEGGDKTLPDGTAFVPELYHGIADIDTSSRKIIEVSQRVVDGPDFNQRLKVLIPLVLLAEVFLIFRPLQHAIEKDKRDERKSRPKWEVEAEEHRRRSASYLARNS